MQSISIKKILNFFIIFSIASYANATELNEKMTFHVTTNQPAQEAIFKIKCPGSDTWLEKGTYHVTEKMPACLIILGESLEANQLEMFVKRLTISSNNKIKFFPQQYKGTWVFVDKSPYYSKFQDTAYTVTPKNNLNFAQLLIDIGGNQDSGISIFFSRGCVELANRPFLPTN
ncbi:TPA: hypothetical protein RJD83_002632 [Legionella pneumophila]|nr:hypothetical protein [Legionella pneumophila]